MRRPRFIDPFQPAEVRRLVREFGSPLVILDCERVRVQYRKLRKALPRVDLHYALKPMPHEAVDPIVAASSLVLALQSIVSRNIDPLETAVITVGMMHGGSMPNIIPDSVVGALARGDILQVLLFAILLGFALMAMGERGERLRAVIDDAAHAVFGVIAKFGGLGFSVGRIMADSNGHFDKPESVRAWLTRVAAEGVSTAE